MMKRRVVGALMLILLCAVAVWALTQGPNNSGAGTNVHTVGNPWSNPNNVATSGMAAAASIPAVTPYSDQLNVTNFLFAIPTGATINGIQASITRKASAVTDVTDAGIFLLKNNSNVGTDHSNGSSWPTSFTAQTYGATNDLWGATWGSTDINSSGFGISIQAFNGNASSTRVASVQGFVTITVTYTGGAGLSFSPGIVGTITRRASF